MEAEMGVVLQVSRDRVRVAGKRLCRGCWLLCVMVLAACSDLSLEFADGRRGTTEDFQGQWVVLNYWAEWCSPCREEIPVLNGLDKKTGIQVVGVNFDNVTGELLAQQMARLGVDFPVLVKGVEQLDNQGLPEVLPTTVILRPDGAFHQRLVGPQTEAMLLAAMGLPSPEPDLSSGQTR